MGASPTSLDKPRRKILKMLMVQQKAHKYWDNGKEKHIPERFGFPKGQWVPTDQNALVTAIRETHEETGINILDAQQYNVRIAIPTFIIPRAEFHIEEVLIYFIVTVEVKPPVCICKCELSGHKWVDMLSGLRGITPTTNPTAAILSQLENINFWGPINSISL